MASQLIDQARILIDQATKRGFELPEELLRVQDALDLLDRNFDRISAVATSKRKTNESLVVNEGLLQEQKQLLEEIANLFKKFADRSWQLPQDPTAAAP